MRIEPRAVRGPRAEAATGFRVEIPNATVIDLGTDFAIEAVQGKKSEVHVFNGEVQINLRGSKTSGASPLHLTTGEATRIDYQTGMPSGIDLDEQRFPAKSGWLSRAPTRIECWKCGRRPTIPWNRLAMGRF